MSNGSTGIILACSSLRLDSREPQSRHDQAQLLIDKAEPVMVLGEESQQM
jgi:hypothetical protein